MNVVNAQTQAAELEAQRALSDVRLLHCQELQAELDQVQKEKLELSQELLKSRRTEGSIHAMVIQENRLRAVVSASSLEEEGLDQIAERMAQSSEMSETVLRSFLMACAGHLVLVPEAISRKIDTDSSYIEVLKIARNRCGDSYEWRHFEKLREAYSQKVI